MIYDVDFDMWIATMLPSFMRRPRIFAFCRALCSPVVWIYNAFLAAQTDHKYRLGHNGQVCYLRSALNEYFDIKRGFEIMDSDDMGRGWVYAKDKDLPRQLMAVDENLNVPTEGEEFAPEHPTPVLSDEVRLNAPYNAFIVYVPSNIYTTRLDEVKAVVDTYRIPSKTPIYTITSASNE